jgi:prepilin-type N-terminal cleavage/methylation domain-containing protein
MARHSQTPNTACRLLRRSALLRAACRSFNAAPWLELRSPASKFQSQRHGMTLIELLVTIVILVTLLAAVLPAVSPNNEGRKIREAARQLVSLFAQAQAQAARDGRPVGVGFSDPDGDGIALEAYILAEPAPFPGFATDSAVRLRFENYALTEIQFVLSGDLIANPSVDPDNCYELDPLPPNTFAFGDVIETSGFRFMLTDADRDGDGQPDTTGNPPFRVGDRYTDSRAKFAVTYIGSGQLIPRINLDPLPSPPPPPGSGWSNPAPYHIRRRPVSFNGISRATADAIQFPRGVGIDLDPVEGNVRSEIMFSPNGSMDSWYIDGFRRESDDVYILLGRIENANPITVANGNDIDYTRYDFNDMPDDDELAERRREVNLLNPDSRWVSVSPAGRVVASEMAFFDPREETIRTGSPIIPGYPAFVDNNGPIPDGDDPVLQRRRQRVMARAYAANYESEGGG